MIIDFESQEFLNRKGEFENALTRQLEEALPQFKWSIHCEGPDPQGNFVVVATYANDGEVHSASFPCRVYAIDPDPNVVELAAAMLVYKAGS